MLKYFIGVLGKESNVYQKWVYINGNVLKIVLDLFGMSETIYRGKTYLLVSKQTKNIH